MAKRKKKAKKKKGLLSQNATPLNYSDKPLKNFLCWIGHTSFYQFLIFIPFYIFWTRPSVEAYSDFLSMFIFLSIAEIIYLRRRFKAKEMITEGKFNFYYILAIVNVIFYILFICLCIFAVWYVNQPDLIEDQMIREAQIDCPVYSATYSGSYMIKEETPNCPKIAKAYRECFLNIEHAIQSGKTKKAESCDELYM